MGKALKAVCFAALFAASGHSTPIISQSQRLLGSSFGIPGTDATYDYVVVGGGTAGLTLASRLVEQTSGSVAVVEAGTFYELTNGNISQVPATDYFWVGKNADDWQPGADWGYVTTPQAVSHGKILESDYCF
jgi:choline dehydrogenase